MYKVCFAEGYDGSTDEYDSLIEQAVKQGREHVAANPSRALQSFKIEVTDEAHHLIFEVTFLRVGSADIVHRAG